MSQIKPRPDRLAKPTSVRSPRRSEGFPRSVRERIIDRSSLGVGYRLCELCCVERATQIHHRKARGMGGTRDVGTNLAANGIDVCTYCHSIAEGHSIRHPQRGWTEVSRALREAWGWQIPKHGCDEPDEVTVLTAVGRVHLGVDGGKRVIDSNERW